VTVQRDKQQFSMVSVAVCSRITGQEHGDINECPFQRCETISLLTTKIVTEKESEKSAGNGSAPVKPHVYRQQLRQPGRLWRFRKKSADDIQM